LKIINSQEKCKVKWWNILPANTMKCSGRGSVNSGVFGIRQIEIVT
jgi:hypothetical protein